MNSLSWFLYFADVLPSVSSTAMFLLLPLFVLGGPLMVAWTIGYLEISEKDKELPAMYKPKWGLFSIVVIVLLLLTTLIPSKETIYLIAGSEAGEAVVTSPEGQEIINDIHQVIKHQLGQLKGDTDK